jgi:hypothetical protein
MAEPNQPVPSRAPRPGGGGLFNEPVREERSFPTAAVSIAAVAVLVLVAVLVFLGHRHSAGAGSPDTLRPLAAYAPNLKITGLAMSEASSFSGAKSTYIDGHVTNTGSATVSGITLQVLFASDGGGAPQLETVPMVLVRTRQPYVDTQPVSAAPLAPGAGADFRLIFEGINPEWNQQTPEIHVVDVETK